MVKENGTQTSIVTFKGEPITLTGQPVQVGQKIPEVTLVSNSLEPVSSSSFKGKICVFVTLPSLDTPVCDLEARRFNQEASRLGPDVLVMTVSRDLPFAQARWCGSHGIKNIQTLSDYKFRTFGQNFGIVWKETELLARAVFVADQNGIIRHIEIVPEITKEPDYDKVISAVKKLLS